MKKTLLLLLLTAALALTSCAGIPPIAIRVEGKHGSYGYSSKGGLTADIHAAK